MTTGPYRFVRHPIYLAIMLFLWAGAVTHHSIPSLLVRVVATGATAVRIVSEERLVVERYPEYADYARRTKRLIPLRVLSGARSRLDESGTTAGFTRIPASLLDSCVPPPPIRAAKPSESESSRGSMRFQRLRRERGRRRAFLLLTFVLAMASPVAAFGSEPLPPRYHAAGMDSWDFWYVHSNGLYYVFYLQSLRDAPVRFVYSTIGMATSPDLIHWTEYGEVLRANPRGQWNDAWVATGSSWWVDDHWQMVFTGQSSTSYRGIGLAQQR